MQHVFRVKKLGWSNEREVICFDSDEYTASEAKALFKEYRGVTQKGYPYTGYEYNGERFYEVNYLGEFKNAEVPKNDENFFELLLERARSNN